MWKYTVARSPRPTARARPERPAWRSAWIRQPVSSPWRTAASFGCSRSPDASPRTAARAAPARGPAYRRRWAMRQRHRVQGAIAQVALEQNMRPHGGAVGGVRANTRSGVAAVTSGGDGTVAPPAPAGTDDAPCMRLHVDLDSWWNLPLARYGVPQRPHTHASAGGWMDHRSAPRKPRAGYGHGRERLELAAPARRAELVPLLAAPVEPL